MASDEMYTLTVGAYSFIGGEEIMWGRTMAFATLVTAPMVVFFAFMQRYIVAGLTQGTVKG